MHVGDAEPRQLLEQDRAVAGIACLHRFEFLVASKAAERRDLRR